MHIDGTILQTQLHYDLFHPFIACFHLFIFYFWISNLDREIKELKTVRIIHLTCFFFLII